MSIQNLFLRAGNEAQSALAQIPVRKKQLYSRLKKLLSNHENETLLKTFAAYFNIKNSIYDHAEKCFSLIETERAKLLSDTSGIKRIDFGAGTKTSANKNTTVGKLCKSASMPKKYARLLHYLIRFHGPETCIELGTCLGISAAYMSTALKANNLGKLISIEGDPASAVIAKSTLANLHISAYAEILTGRFTDVLPNVLSAEKNIGLAFIDGHHNGAATLQYYEMLRPHLTQYSIIIFDDIDWSDDMQAAWKMLCTKPEFSICLDLGRLGLCVFSTENKPKIKAAIKI